MDEIKNLIKNARDERETGDPNKALAIFLEIDKTKLNIGNLMMDYLGELGLTYWHLKKFEEAKNTFLDALKLAEEKQNKSYSALFLRHLSRPEFNKENPDLSVEYAKQARQIAFDEKRSDVAWFDHGVVAALISTKSDLNEIKKWFDIEAEDLNNISKNIKDEIAKWVWVIGLLIDRAKIFDTISDLYIALMIADHFNLARKKEQIEKAIEEFDKN